MPCLAPPWRPQGSRTSKHPSPQGCPSHTTWSFQLLANRYWRRPPQSFYDWPIASALRSRRDILIRGLSRILIRSHLLIVRRQRSTFDWSQAKGLVSLWDFLSHLSILLDPLLTLPSPRAVALSSAPPNFALKFSSAPHYSMGTALLWGFQAHYYWLDLCVWPFRQDCFWN